MRPGAVVFHASVPVLVSITDTTKALPAGTAAGGEATYVATRFSAGIARATPPGSSITRATSADTTCLKLTLPFSSCARLFARLRAGVHDQHVLEVPQVHGGNEDGALEGSVLAFGDLNDLTEDQAFRIERFQVIPDREAGRDHDIADFDVLRLEDPVHHEGVAVLPADDPGGARALNERGHSRARVGHQKDLAVVVADLAYSADHASIGDDDVVEEHAVLRAGAEDDGVKEARRVPRDDRGALRLELQGLRRLGELHALLRLERLLAELDVFESELVDPRFERVVVGPEVLDLGDRLPEAAGRRADLAENALGGDQELGYKGRAGPNKGGVTEEKQGEGDDKEGGKRPEEGISGTRSAAGAPKSGH